MQQVFLYFLKHLHLHQACCKKNPFGSNHHIRWRLRNTFPNIISLNFIYIFSHRKILVLINESFIDVLCHNLGNKSRKVTYLVNNVSDCAPFRNISNVIFYLIIFCVTPLCGNFLIINVWLFIYIIFYLTLVFFLIFLLIFIF